MNDFRDYLRAWAKARGRGEYRKISKELGIHTTLTSQILNGRKCLTEEQAARLCHYMKLNSAETDYFLKLVQLERAGTEFLADICKRHLAEMRDRASEVKNQLPDTRKLSEQDRAIFYSSWQYTLVRLLTSIPNHQTPLEISVRLEIPVSRTQEILDFLVSRGLCTLSNGRYSRTERNTHIEARSPLAVRHHQNWRSRSLSFLENLTTDDLAFTAPIALAKRDFSKVKGILLATISQISNVVQDSENEDVAYLGIDWLKL